MDFPTTWSKLEQGLVLVLNPFENSLSYARYMELYTYVYNYCTRATPSPSARTDTATRNGGANLLGGELYHSLKDLFRIHLQETLSSANGLKDETLLITYNKHWNRFTTGATLIHHIFKYLNRHWIRREIDEGHKNIYDVYTLSLVSWKEHFFRPLSEQIISAVLKLVEQQRNGMSIDTTLIRSIVESYVALGLDENDTAKSTLDTYQTFFEAPFLEATAKYYSMEATQFLKENSVTEYMKKAETRLAEEEVRLQMYLHSSTHDPLIKTSEKALISDYAQVLQNEFQSLLDADRIADLSRMYGLLVRVPEGLDQLRSIFEEYVKNKGLAAIANVVELSAAAANGTAATNEEGEGGGGDDEDQQQQPQRRSVTRPKRGGSSDVDPKIYVDAILGVHKKYADLTSTAFRSEPGFVAALDKACREFINRNEVCKDSSTKSPELLARFCDAILKKSSKVAEFSEVEALLNNIYVEDKDVFQQFYQKMYAKRLVNQTSASEDSEASMIGKLKEACGFEYTSKLQRMYTDMPLSKDINDAFSEQMQKSHSKDEMINFEIMVLTSGVWPLQAPTTSLNIPAELLKTFERFQTFYQAKHSGRKLTWLMQFSKGELRTNYLKASKAGYTFQVSTYQMSILLQFNNALSYSQDDLAKLTDLSPEILQGNLNLLCRAKVLVLNDGSYVLNEDFKSKKIRVNLNLPIRSEQKAEIDDTHKTVEEDRKIVIQTRKAMKHVALINEVISQLQSRFKPKVQDIKRCIDILMEKEYIERMDGEKDMYSYLA